MDAHAPGVEVDANAHDVEAQVGWQGAVGRERAAHAERRPVCNDVIVDERLEVVELYIDDDKELFHSLHEKKDAIEADSGLSFDWRELPQRKASRIVIEKSVDLDDKDTWVDQFDWAADTLLRMRKAFSKYL